MSSPLAVEVVCRKPITVGPFRLDRGDLVTEEMAELLPPGRMKVLVDQGVFRERPLDKAALIELLDQRVAALEVQIAELVARRPPGRPKTEG